MSKIKNIFKEYSLATISAILLLLFTLVFVASSTVFIQKDSVGHLVRLFGDNSKDNTRIIMLANEKGRQAEILGPGTHFRPFFKFWYDIEELPLTIIKPDYIGLIVAQDGHPLDEGEIVAEKWKNTEYENMLDAEYFLKNKGKKGPQLSILKPGIYRLNRYLFSVTNEKLTTIEPGYVGVIRSSINENEKCAESHDIGVVEKGCSGIWDIPLLPKKYPLNKYAYEVTTISTKEHSLNFLGGYTKRMINLEHGPEGYKASSVTEEKIPVPPDAVEKAIVTRVEGWVVPLELRVVASIKPEHAPYVVAHIGTLEEVERNVIIPIIKSIVRDQVQTMKVFDIVEKRSELKTVVESTVIPSALKYGVTISNLRFGDPVLPPELLTARRREQLAIQLAETFKEEEQAQQQRIKSEHAKTLANNQEKLAVAEVEKEALRLKGEGVRLKMSEISKGLKEREDLLGRDTTRILAIYDRLLEAATKEPSIVKVPHILVQGNSSLEGAAAILGTSDLYKSFSSCSAVIGGELLNDK